MSEPGPPLGQQEAQSRGRKGGSEVGGSCSDQEGGALGGRNRERERGREGSRPVRAELRLHVEHVGRALVVPVPEAGVAWALQLQDILFPGGAERKGGGSRRKERWKGGREGGWKGGRQERRKENREPWLGTLRSRHRWWLERARQEVREGLLRILLP